MGDDELIVTDFELAEEVFVPAGDGEPAQWKPRGDLTAGQIERYLEGGTAERARHGERIERWKAIGAEAKKRGFQGERTLDEFLSPPEVDEFTALDMAIDAHDTAFAKRRAAIDRDIAAGRYRVLRWKEPRPQPPE
jgi:hypothetical protein